MATPAAQELKTGPRNREPGLQPSSRKVAANAKPCAWSCGLAARIARRVGIALVVLPLARSFARIRVEGLENLESVNGPVILAANHGSELDTPVLFAALPSKLRHRTAVTMCDWMFAGNWFGERFRQQLRYYVRVVLFNGFTLPRTIALRRSLRHAGELTERGYSILIYPEGEHSTSRLPFHPGAAFLATRLNLPVVPASIQGMDKVLPPGAKFARRGSVVVRFGPPLSLSGSDFRRSVLLLEQAIRDL